MKNKATNKKLQNKITKQCKNCEVKKEMGRCPYANRLECTDCNIIIAETVLSNYSSYDLLHIPINSIIKGIQAHKYTGELRQTKVVTI